MATPKKVVFVACPVCNLRLQGKELGQHILQAHKDTAWREYAQVYLEKMWFGQRELDRRLVERFKNTVTGEMLHDLFVKYGVIRTVPGDGVARLKAFAGMLNSYRAITMTKANISGIVEREVVSMRETYGKGPLSAITKSFWMMKQHPVVIYDDNTWRGLWRRGLAPGYKRYGTYFDSWFKFFDDPETQKGLDDALTWLPDSPAAKQLVEKAQKDTLRDGQEAAEKGRLVAEEIRALAASQLMRNRVTDMHLFYEGGGFLEDSLSCNLAERCR
jgi:hypothetical protein